MKHQEDEIHEQNEKESSSKDIKEEIKEEKEKNKFKNGEHHFHDHQHFHSHYHCNCDEFDERRSRGIEMEFGRRRGAFSNIRGRGCMRGRGNRNFGGNRGEEEFYENYEERLRSREIPREYQEHFMNHSFRFGYPGQNFQGGMNSDFHPHHPFDY